MGKISTREEINLRYLGDKNKLKEDIFNYKVEKSDETRQAVLDLGDPEIAVLCAFHIDIYPRDDTRQVACKSSKYAYYYAADVDGCPRDDTRAAVLSSPDDSYCYARYVDQCPRDDTRAAVCKKAEYAYYYATDVDEEPRQDTRQAAAKSDYWKKEYEIWEKSLQKKK